MVTHPDINPAQQANTARLFGEQTGTGVFPLVIAVPLIKTKIKIKQGIQIKGFNCCYMLRDCCKTM